MKRSLYKITLLIAIILFFTQSKCFADDNNQQSVFTGAQEIAPKELPAVQNHTYDEGLKIKQIDIKGNYLIKKDLILSNFSLKEGDKFDRSIIQNELKKVYNMGYFTEKIKATPVATPEGIKLIINVEENVPVTGFNLKGNKTVSSQEISEILNKQTGLPQNIETLNKSVQEIENLYAQNGYILARVKKISDDPDGVINVEINEGVIDDIKITGNTRTKEFVIKRNIATTTGQVYNENLLKQDLSRLFGTQAFADVRRVLTVSPENPDKYLLTIEVDEKRTGSISVGGGVDTNTGFFGSVGYADNNFRGLGQELSTTFTTGSGVLQRDYAVLNRADFQFEVNFIEPRLKQSLNSLQIKGFGRQFASYQVPLSVEKRFGAEVELARPIKKFPHLAGSLNMGLENIHIKEGNESLINEKFADKNINISRRADQLVSGTLISVGPSLIYDTRNNLLNPTDGIYSSIGYKQSFGLTDIDSFGRATATIRKFYPIGEKSTFTIGAKTGGSIIGDMPEFASFRLGGPSSIRGFREGTVGYGNSFILTSAEFRTPVPFMNKITEMKFFRDIRAVGFIDAGQVYDKTLSNDIFGRRGYGISVGTGLRINVPGIGPVKVDYGYPLTAIGDGIKKGGKFTFDFGEYY